MVWLIPWKTVCTITKSEKCTQAVDQKFADTVRINNDISNRCNHKKV